jgi:hypothetical protein
MPRYSLQHRNNTNTAWVDCGHVVVVSANAGGINGVARGHSGDGTSIPNSQYTAKSGGNGTWNNPVAGDAINLANYSASGSDGTSYTFGGNATFQTAQVSPPKNAGYYFSGSIPGDDSDWTATGSSPEPSGGRY